MPPESPRPVPTEASPDPPERGPRYRMVKIRAGPAQRYVCLSQRCQAYLTHWEPFTRPCYGDWRVCEGCKHFLAKRWSAYLMGLETGSGEQVIVPITEWAARGAGLGELRRRNVSLRGVGLALRRMGVARNSMVELKLLKLSVDVGDLPAAGPILPTLLAVWGLDDYTPPVISLWEEESDDGEPERRDTAER